LMSSYSSPRWTISISTDADPITEFVGGGGEKELWSTSLYFVRAKGGFEFERMLEKISNGELLDE